MHTEASANWFPGSARAGLALFWSACAEHFPNALRAARERLRTRSAGALQADEATEREDAQLFAHVAAGTSGDFGGLEQLLSEVGATWARERIDLQHWYEAIETFRARLMTPLLGAYSHDLARLEPALLALQRLIDQATRVITREFLRERERELAAERQQTEEALLRFTRLSESGVIGIMLCDTDGRISDVNEALASMLGYTREELLSGITWIELTPPEWKHTDIDALEQLRSQGRSRVWEKEYLRKDRSRVPILVGVAMLHAGNAIAFILDITERKHLEALHARSLELEAEHLRTLEASRMRSAFLANMSHELRTPLNSIIGFADILYHGDVPDGSPRYREFAGDILKSGQHLLRLINDVLDLAKVESGKMSFRPEPIVLPEIVSEVCLLLRTWAADKHIQLECSVHPEVHHVIVDPARLRQVLYNYLSNALKFTHADGRVRVSAGPSAPGFFRVEVADTGVGISDADLDRLFVEFQQLDAGSSKRHGGTGLGLALTKRIVEAQGGTVGVHSVPGVGSTFYALLPCSPDGALQQH